MVRDGRNTQVPDGDSIEGLEIVDKAERAILLLDAEPVGMVGGVRTLVHTRCKFLLEDFDDVFEDLWWNRKVLVCPVSWQPTNFDLVFRAPKSCAQSHVHSHMHCHVISHLIGHVIHHMMRTHYYRSRDMTSW